MSVVVLGNIEPLSATIDHNPSSWALSSAFSCFADGTTLIVELQEGRSDQLWNYTNRHELPHSNRSARS